MSRIAGRIVAEQIRDNPHSILALPTGNTPKGMYDFLVAQHEEGRLDCSSLTTFNLDEYWGLTPEHPSSFAYYINEHFLHHVNVPPAKTHWPAVSGPPDEAAAAYEASIVHAGGFDMAVLGLGINGHIGFNEPGTPFDSRTHVVKLEKETRQASVRGYYGFASPEDVPEYGITIGIGTICEARKILMLVSGSTKAKALAFALEGPVSTALPASALQQHPDVTIVADEAAAFALARSKKRSIT